MTAADPKNIWFCCHWRLIMKDKKQIHIISHTHWDREWYLPYEKYHVMLVQMMDTLLETMEKNPDYKSFHLDGQTIILDDYLQVRPHMREKIQQFINEGRLHVGSWYILQDEFLTSSEANVRNLQYGMKDAKEWGNLSKIGYFPDSFGNMGQAPQILKQAGIHHAVFGRGVKPTGFNNMVVETEDYESPYSEMYWQSPDGSSVMGILFANWYCNGNEVPVDETAAKKYWDAHLESLEKYAATPHMLMMNGCDHQPIQTDLPEAIETAKKLYSDVEFIHSNFNDYIEKLSETVPADLKSVDGELRSQQTDGWGTLVNTASARVYLKQMNRENEVLLEKVAEPLATFSYMHGGKYDHDMLAYAWKTLMQNHPHDSICGCSVDEVHREMVTRFEKAKHVTEMIVDESLESITSNINTNEFSKYGEDSLPFTVYNTTGYSRTGAVSVIIDVKREYFADGVNQDKLRRFDLGDKKLVDVEGNVYSFEMEDLGIEFDYDLPNDKFRQPYMARRVKLTFEAQDVPALGYKTFAWVNANASEKMAEAGTLIAGEHAMENEYLHVDIAGDGSLSVTEKATGRTYTDLCVYEDTGDIGNEYMYKQPNGEEALTTKDVPATINLVEDTPFRATYQIVHEWELPKSATDLLDEEQQNVVWFTSRKATRTKETIPFTIKTTVSLEKHDKGINVTSSFDNQVKDHRLRTLFPTNIKTDYHHADSIFEVAKRVNEPAKEWTNPDYSQHQQAFVDVSNQEEGLLVANKGLNEYEILRDGKNTIAVTLIRSVREMGDWGYFPTPEAQCLGEHTVSFRIYPHQGEKTLTEAYHDGYQYQIPWSIKQADIQEGELPSAHSFIEWKGNHLAFSSLKVAEATGDVMLRWFNPTGEEEALELTSPEGTTDVYKTNIIEEQQDTLAEESDDRAVVQVGKYEIITIGCKK